MNVTKKYFFLDFANIDQIGNTKRSNPTCNLKHFAIEYSKTSRAGCRGCDWKIMKGEIRIMKLMFDTEIAKRQGSQPYWYHMKCFVKVRRIRSHFFLYDENILNYVSASRKISILLRCRKFTRI